MDFEAINKARNRKRDHLLIILVTVGIVLDWVPGYLIGSNSFLASGTKLIIFPLLLFDFIRRPDTYLIPSFGWIFVGAYLVGVGGGVIFGTLPQFWMLRLLPSVLILLFYSKRRTIPEIRSILNITLWSALIVPLVYVLASIGIGPSGNVVETEQFTRIFVGTNKGSFTLLLLIIPASIGGFLLRPSLRKFSLTRHAQYVIFLLLTLWGTLLIGQRAAVITVLGCLVLAWLLGFRLQRGSKTLVFVFLLCILMGLLYPYYVSEEIDAVINSGTIRLRSFDDMSATKREEAIDIFLSDLWPLQLVGQGDAEIYQKIKSGPHFLLGEAYYTGGLIMLVTIVLLLWVGGRRVANTWLREREGQAGPIALVLLVMFLGFLFYMNTHPILNARIVPMMLGLWLSLDPNSSSEAVLSRTTTTVGYSTKFKETELR